MTMQTRPQLAGYPLISQTVGQLIAGCNSFEQETTLHELHKYYTSPGRYYHNLTHIEKMLGSFLYICEYFKLNVSCETLIAILFHDAVYSIGKTDNEINSAKLALDFIVKYNIPVNSVIVEEFILATKNHLIPDNPTLKPTSPFDWLILDLDLEILSSKRSDYEQFGADIYREYNGSEYPSTTNPSHISYVRGRIRVLTGYAKRKELYTSLPFFQKEETAKANLWWEINYWSSWLKQAGLAVQ